MNFAPFSTEFYSVLKRSSSSIELDLVLLDGTILKQDLTEFFYVLNLPQYGFIKRNLYLKSIR